MKKILLALWVGLVGLVGFVLSVGCLAAEPAPDVHRFGCIKDKAEGWIFGRDKHYSAPRLAAPLPAAVDLRTNMPPVYYQGALGSCTANAIAAAWDFEHHLQGNSFITPSRLFIYYNERKIEGTIQQDAGAQIRDGLITVTKDGVCRELIWPYNISAFTLRPIYLCYQQALKEQVLQSQRVTQDLVTMKTVLATGHPIVIGFSVYASFETDAVTKTGLVPIPKPGEQLLGGHAVVVVGYSDALKMPGAKDSGAFLVRNSWGKSWGLQGHCWMAYEYLTNKKMAHDFWAILKVE